MSVESVLVVVRTDISERTAPKLVQKDLMANIVHFVVLLTVRLVDTQTEYVPVKQGGQGGIAQQNV